MSSPPTHSRALPERTPEQRREALAHANEVRRLRAALKAELKAGRVSIIPLIEGPPAYLHTARVRELLAAVPGYGPVRATDVLWRCRISDKKTLGGLSARQRRELISALEGVPARVRQAAQRR